jgi:outer membrane protein TolC
LGRTTIAQQEAAAPAAAIAGAPKPAANGQSMPAASPSAHAVGLPTLAYTPPADPLTRTSFEQAAASNARPADRPDRAIQLAADEELAAPLPAPPRAPQPAPNAIPQPVLAGTGEFIPLPPIDEHNQLTINLPTALRLADANNPTIAYAAAQVDEAFALLRAAKVACLPDLSTGPQYLRHDGRLQATEGNVLSTSKQSLFMQGDVSLSWDLSNLLYSRLIAEQVANATGFQEQAVTNSIQLDVCLAYLDLLRAKALLAILSDTLTHADELIHNAEAAAQAGLGKTTADVNRARTEINLRRQELTNLEGDAAVASARLARLLRLKPSVDLLPADPTVVPVVLVPGDMSYDALVALGMSRRPELQNSRLLVGAASERLRQAQVAPWLPRLEVGYVAGTFGGGIGSELDTFGSRSDGYAQAIWELHNMGAGDHARIASQRSAVDAAMARRVEVETEIGEEVASAAKQIHFREASLASAQEAVRQALEAWRKLRESSFGLADKQYDPLQPLIALRDLHRARQEYLDEVIEYDRAQFRLYWALGQPPLCAMQTAAKGQTVIPLPTSYEAIAPGK